MKTTIYKVIQICYITVQGDRYNEYNERIEETSKIECNVLLFTDYQKSMDYAYNIAKSHHTNTYPISKEVKMSKCYNYGYDYIEVIEDVLDFDSDILNSTKNMLEV